MEINGSQEVNFVLHLNVVTAMVILTIGYPLSIIA
jgi:hypothetical protein